MRRITRRQFGRLIAGGVVLSLVGGCSSQSPSSIAIEPTSAQPATSSGALPSPTSEGFSDFFAVRINPIPPVDSAMWVLSVDGMVKKPAQLTLADVRALRAVSQVSRLKCVECWSAAARWEGFRYDALSAVVEPDPEATFVHFRCEDGYFESLTIEELRSLRVLFAYGMNGAPLTNEHGAPLRLIVPPKYGYKGSKLIKRLTFAKERLKGYWSDQGDFTVEGDIQQGVDHPVDLAGERSIDGGEIRYPDGPEAGG